MHCDSHLIQSFLFAKKPTYIAENTGMELENTETNGAMN